MIEANRCIGGRLWLAWLAAALLTGCLSAGGPGGEVGVEHPDDPGADTTPISAPAVPPEDIDTLFFVEHVLEHFTLGDTNGPVVELVEGFWCPADAGCEQHPPSRERIRAHAEEQGLRLVPADAPPIPCTWNQVTDSEWRGRRMQLSPPHQIATGEWLVRVWTTCQVHEGRGFFYLEGHEFERTSEGWRATGRVITMIT